MSTRVPRDDWDAAVPGRGPDAESRKVRPEAQRPAYGDSFYAEPEAHLRDYFKVIYKRRWVALSAFVLVLIVTVMTTATAVPMYEARAQLLIERENTNLVPFREPYEQNRLADDYYQTQYRILQSRAMARRTLDLLNLWDDPRLSAAPPAQWSARRIVFAPVRFATRLFRGTPPPRAEAPGADETRKQAAAINRVLGGLTITPINRSRLVDVKFTSHDPTLTALIANGVSRAFIEQSLELRFLSSKEASDWLSQRLAEQREQVDASERALQAYREQNGAIALDGSQDVVVQKLADLNAAVTRAKTDRIEREAAYRQIQTIQHDPAALDTVPAILSNAYVQQLKAELSGLQRQLREQAEKFGDKHPTIITLKSTIQASESKLLGEVRKVVQSVHNQFLAAQAEERSLTEALNQQKAEALSMNRRGIEYAVLAREAASNRQIFDSLMQRTKEAGITGELRTSHIRIVDAAEEPTGPSSPNRQRDLVIGIFVGLTLALTLAFFFEYLDNRIKTPEEVRQYLGLPFLGMLPALFEKDVKDPVMSGSVPNTFSEAFRALRTNLFFASAAEGARSVIVTSTGPGEGKTVVAANVAIALAQAGQRVVLIDADMRRPRVHSIFEKPQQPGLSNVLVGNAKTSDALHESSVPGLWIMTSGQHPPNPAELLGSKRFKDFLAPLGEHFDWIIIDTPPVMAVTDVSVIAHLVTGVLFVVGAEMTARQPAYRATEQLRHARANFMGAVLNRVDLKHNAYYYSQYYRREYAAYYETSAKV